MTSPFKWEIIFQIHSLAARACSCRSSKTTVWNRPSYFIKDYQLSITWGQIPCSVEIYFINRHSWNSDYHLLGKRFCYYSANYVKWDNFWITLHWTCWIIRSFKEACVYFPCSSSGSSRMSSIPPLRPQQHRLQQNWSKTEALPVTDLHVSPWDS